MTSLASSGLWMRRREMDESLLIGQLIAIYLPYMQELVCSKRLKGLSKNSRGGTPQVRLVLKPYQFLISLYGRTGNLVEFYSIWRSLKLAHPKMAYISYLNMTQVLVKLKDLPGAEPCFKEWESRCSTYDVRIVNALLGAYLKEGMLKKLKLLRGRQKGKGQGLMPKAGRSLRNTT